MATIPALPIILISFFLTTHSAADSKSKEKEAALQIDEVALNMMLMGQTMPMVQLVPLIGMVVKNIIMYSKKAEDVTPELASLLRVKVLDFVDPDKEKRDKVRLALKLAEEKANRTAEVQKDNKLVMEQIGDEVTMIFAKLLDSL